MRAVATPDQIAERRRLGQDRFDEIWEGVYRMNAAPHPRHSFLLRHLTRLLDPIAELHGLIPLGEFNIGEPTDFRIPDAGYVDELPDAAFTSAARIVIEVLSPHDDTMAKLALYARYNVDEVLIVDPPARGATWLALDRAAGSYSTTDRSSILGVSADEVSGHLPWEKIES